jgi:hypothetical protein
VPNRPIGIIGMPESTKLAHQGSGKRVIYDNV